MLKAVVIEDEFASRNALRNMLLEHCHQVRLPGRDDLDTVAKGVQAIRQEQPDMVFLDIRLSDRDEKENGFTLLEKVQDVPFELVFVTAHRDYSVTAINKDFRTCYFLQKPFYLQDLKDAVQRVEENVLHKQNQVLKNQTYSQIPGRLYLPVTSGLELVPLSKIVLLEGDGNITKVRLWLESKPRIISHNLGWFEKQIAKENSPAFFRTHASFMVNRDYVRLFTHEGKKAVLTMYNNLIAKVSEDRKTEVLAWLKNQG